MFSACKAPSIKPQLRAVWSFSFNQCYCQMYDLNNIKPLEELYACDFSYCDDLVGFSFESWSKDITPWAKELSKWGEDSCD